MFSSAGSARSCYNCNTTLCAYVLNFWFNSLGFFSNLFVFNMVSLCLLRVALTYVFESETLSRELPDWLVCRVHRWWFIDHPWSHSTVYRPLFFSSVLKHGGLKGVLYFFLLKSVLFYLIVCFVLFNLLHILSFSFDFIYAFKCIKM